MSHNPASFGEVLRQLRTSATFSGSPSRACWTQPAGSATSSGARRTPHLSTVRLLADALELSPADRQEPLPLPAPEDC